MLDQFAARITAAVASATSLDPARIEPLVARQPKPELGDYSFATFALAKERGQAPPAIAKELAPAVGAALADAGVTCEAAGPYLNFRLDKRRAAGAVLARVLGGAGLLPTPGAGKTVVIDFSSPNIAKPFTMGHLRSTTIGNALSRIHAALGWRTVRVNHLGDWGTQFGKLIVAFKRWGDAGALETRGIAYLMELYVRVNEAAKAEPALDDEARAAFKSLEDGDVEARALWSRFREISLAEFERIYRVLGVEFDSYAGESFYNDKVEAAVARLAEAGLVEESEGALVVQVEEGTPPCMVRKSDGATTYAARDLAALFYRQAEYGFDKLLYVVGAPQALHFRQVFAALCRLGVPWAAACQHVPFGQVLKEGELMSTRKGNVVFLEDVINRVAELALEKAVADEELSPEQVTEELRERARRVAVSSIVFFDLAHGRIKDIDFDWDEILNPRGETGVYLQYAHARIHGILRKFEARTGLSVDTIAAAPPQVTEDAAYPIALALAAFPDKVAYAAETSEPSVVSRYLLDLASAFSTWYRANKVINEDDADLSGERLAVVLAVKRVLGEGLRLLGIEPLERM